MLKRKIKKEEEGRWVVRGECNQGRRPERTFLPKEASCPPKVKSTSQIWPKSVFLRPKTKNTLFFIWEIFLNNKEDMTESTCTLQSSKCLLYDSGQRRFADLAHLLCHCFGSQLYIGTSWQHTASDSLCISCFFPLVSPISTCATWRCVLFNTIYVIPWQWGMGADGLVLPENSDGTHGFPEEKCILCGSDILMKHPDNKLSRYANLLPPFSPLGG